MSPRPRVSKTDTRLSIPVAAVLERVIDTSKKWVVPQWSLHSVIAGEHLQQAQAGNPSVKDASMPVIIHESGGLRRSIHGGLSLDLFKDGSEGYWYNLLSEDPYLFVVCEGEPNAMEVKPFTVTANQDEATGHLETDDMVLSAPMPNEVRDLLEHYVIDHYEPVIKKKRKRRDWLEDSLYVNSPDVDKTRGGT